MQQPVERGKRLILLLSAAELTAVEAFRTKHNLSSRSEAIHEILRRSLGVSEPKVIARPAAKPAAALPLTKPMTKPWHRAKRRSLNEP